MENSFRLFDGFPMTRRIWIKVGQWLGDAVILSNENLRNYVNHFDKVKAGEERLTVGVFWIAVLWSVYFVTLFLLVLIPLPIKIIIIKSQRIIW